jgi:hypothetical protein
LWASLKILKSGHVIIGQKILQDATLQESSKQRKNVLFLYKNPETTVPALPYRKILVIVFSKKLEAVRETERGTADTARDMSLAVRRVISDAWADALCIARGSFPAGLRRAGLGGKPALRRFGIG